jgi:hypothetical protein
VHKANNDGTIQENDSGPPIPWISVRNTRESRQIRRENSGKW